MKTENWTKTTISQRVRFIIDEKFEKSPSDFATATGIKKTTVFYIVNNENVYPKADTLQLMVNCEQANINPAWLLMGEGSPYRGEEDRTEIDDLKKQIKELEVEISRYTKKGMDVMVDNERLRTENTELKRLLETIKVDPKMESA
jgi:transcriptional regulator with XRE-family HTH domain